MASSIIHMAVANEINKVLKRDNDKLLIGSIAPDISKQVGQTKLHSHFLDNNDTNIPNMDRFLEKYKDKLDDDFVMGYYIHLLTDYFWFKNFIPEIYENNLIKKLDGKVVNCKGNMAIMYIYNDYTNLNIQVIDEYHLDFKIFYNEIPKIDFIIEEIPMDKLSIILNKVEKIIEDSKETKELVFNLDNIINFINLSVKLVLSNLQDLGVVYD